MIPRAAGRGQFSREKRGQLSGEIDSGDQYRCTCPSKSRPACWHRAAVATVRASRRGFGLAADGPNAHEAPAWCVYQPTGLDDDLGDIAG